MEREAPGGDRVGRESRAARGSPCHAPVRPGRSASVPAACLVVISHKLTGDRKMSGVVAAPIEELLTEGGVAGDGPQRDVSVQQQGHQPRPKPAAISALVCGESQPPDRSTSPAREPVAVRLTRDTNGTTLAAGMPARSMPISSPRSTRSMMRDRCVLASCMLLVDGLRRHRSTSRLANSFERRPRSRLQRHAPDTPYELPGVAAAAGRLEGPAAVPASRTHGPGTGCTNSRVGFPEGQVARWSATGSPRSIDRDARPRAPEHPSSTQLMTHGHKTKMTQLR
jgi:hypothetical protein